MCIPQSLRLNSVSDVSGLFPDVLKNMQTDDLEQKKLVYLYLMNYAKTQPELVILAVNTFVKDSDDPNPLVRALAIRTMGCLRAEKIIDYLCDPLQKCLRDENPYVRKTAALCVAKLYDLKPELVIDNGFLEQLQEMISDTNPMVSLVNTRQSLDCIHLRSGCCQYCGCTYRYPHCCCCVSLYCYLVTRSRHLHCHPFNS
jgi:AP-1 complex subunit beta-1